MPAMWRQNGGVKRSVCDVVEVEIVVGVEKISEDTTLDDHRCDDRKKSDLRFGRDSNPFDDD